MDFPGREDFEAIRAGHSEDSFENSVPKKLEPIDSFQMLEPTKFGLILS